MNIEKQKNHNYYNQGLLIIISSPSGAGKTTLCQKIVSKDNNIHLSVSFTTRKKRKSEINKKHYVFISIKEFAKMKKQKLLLENAKVFGNYYGTPLKKIIDKLELNKDVLFDIDWQGAKQIRKKFPNNVVDIFIMPPSIKELRKRLIKRNQDDINVVDKRMKMAFKEIYQYKDYKYVLINDDLTKTLKKIINIIKIERNSRLNLKKVDKLLFNKKKLI